MSSVDYFNKNKSGERSSVLFVVLGFVSGLISLFIYPYSFITGILGIVLGILAIKNGNRVGLAVIISNIVLMGISFIYSEAIMSYLMYLLDI